ncbi:hypothetical protein ACLKA7_003328 [Drosophila subpalustris]
MKARYMNISKGTGISDYDDYKYKKALVKWVAPWTEAMLDIFVEMLLDKTYLIDPEYDKLVSEDEQHPHP